MLQWMSPSERGQISLPEDEGPWNRLHIVCLDPINGDDMT